MRDRHLTVVALVGADRQATRGFLDLLAESLAEGDTVVLSGPRDSPSRSGSWHTVGDGRLVRASRPGRWHDVVIVLDERVVPIGPWPEALARALVDRTVGAAAARTNIAAGDELLVGVPYRPREGTVHRTFVRQRARMRTLTDVHRLDGPSLAVRLGDFEAAGGCAVLEGPSPVAALAGRLLRHQRRLVVAEGSYLHHSGGPGPRSPVSEESGPGGRPFVSACMIVKDERDTLTRCLGSLEGFADEVVVYDTGSSDGTPELARAHGATVIEGFWDGDFARARNASLEHCRGQWILWIDADEELACGDREATRCKLAGTTATAEGLIVQIDNVRANEASTALAHPACRLFRRACAHWSGRLHEQVRARAGSPEIQTVFAEDVRITHWGYLQRTVEARAKGWRNVRSAVSELVDGDVPRETQLVNLARSYALCGQPEESIELCRGVLSGEPAPHVRRLALRTLIDGLLGLGLPGEALDELDALRRVSAAPVTADIAEGRALLALGKAAEALAAFDRVGEGLDDDGFEHGIHDVAVHKATCLALLGRHGDAADALLECLREKGGMDAPVATLIGYLERAGRPPSELVMAVPAERSVAFLGQLVHAEPAAADAALETWYARSPSLAVLATATKVAPSFGLDRQLVWSGRLREHGLGNACPLISGAAGQQRPAATRLLGAALAAHVWGDPRGRQAMGALAGMLDGGTRAGVAAQVAAVAPTMSAVLDGFAGASPDSPGSGRSGPFPPASLPGHGGPSRTRRVLVVDRQPGGLRTMAVAVELRRAGHLVTVLWPGTAAVPGGVLDAAGVTVTLWGTPPEGGPDGPWQISCSDAVARASALEPFDTVVLARSVLAAQPVLRALVPGARIVADLDEGRAGSGGGDCNDGRDPATDGLGADLVLTSETSVAEALPAGTPVVVMDASADALYQRAPATPWTFRTGVCVVGDFAVGGEEALTRWEGTVAPALADHLGLGSGSAAPLPVCVVGSDPQGRVARPFPGALSIGATEDPVPWLRAARVAVIAAEHGARHWASAAGLAGTPAVVVPAPGRSDEDAHALGQMVRTIRALADAQASPHAPATERRPGPGDGGTCGPSGPRPVPRDPLTGLGVTRTARRGAGVEVRAGLPPDPSPAKGDRMVVDLRWGYEPLPVEWVGPVRGLADEVWAPTSWNARVLVESGIPSQRVHVVPPGVDVERFGPHRRPYPLRSAKGVTLLFVGDCDEASGVDALLGAYLTTFSGADPVCLVVRPTGSAERATFLPEVRRAATAGRGRPAVEVIEGELPDDGLPGLFRACDVLVHPHRATGSPDVVLAAMASGRPVVTLDGGSAAAVCDERTGWLVRSRPVRALTLPMELLPSNEVRQLEPSRAALAEALREAAASTDRRIRKGLAARDRAVSTFALDRREAVVAARVEALGAGGEPAVA